MTAEDEQVKKFIDFLDDDNALDKILGIVKKTNMFLKNEIAVPEKENAQLKKVEENEEWKKLEHWRLFELYKKAHPGDFQHLTKDDQHYSREELFKFAFILGCAVREKAEHVENLTYKSFEWLM